MQLEKNMYVRSKYGYIGKIVKFSEAHLISKNIVKEIHSTVIVDTHYDFDDENDAYLIGEITKASHNIIDLIEPLDLLYIDIDPHDGHGGIVVPRVPETMNEVKKYVDGIKKDEIRLVGIVTRKVIQDSCYWLEKSDE